MNMEHGTQPEALPVYAPDLGVTLKVKLQINGYAYDRLDYATPRIILWNSKDSAVPTLPTSLEDLRTQYGRKPAFFVLKTLMTAGVSV